MGVGLGSGCMLAVGIIDGSGTKVVVGVGLGTLEAAGVTLLFPPLL